MPAVVFLGVMTSPAPVSVMLVQFPVVLGVPLVPQMALAARMV